MKKTRPVTAFLALAAALLAPAGALAADPDRPTSAKGWYEKGSVHHKIGELDVAVASYKEAYKLDPQPIHLYNIALALGQSGRWAEAVHFYELYLADDPDSPLKPEIEAQLVRLRKLAAERALAPASAPSPGADVTKLPDLVVGTSEPVVPEGYARGKRRGLAIGLAAGAAALVVAAAVTVSVILARGSPTDRYLGDYDGRIIDLRPQ